jgi:hypothetical protein
MVVHKCITRLREEVYVWLREQGGTHGSGGPQAIAERGRVRAGHARES